jgi:hypothetical protein
MSQGAVDRTCGSLRPHACLSRKILPGLWQRERRSTWAHEDFGKFLDSMAVLFLIIVMAEFEWDH